LLKSFPLFIDNSRTKGGGIPSSNKSFYVGEACFKVFVFFGVNGLIKWLIAKTKSFGSAKSKARNKRRMSKILYYQILTQHWPKPNLRFYQTETTCFGLELEVSLSNLKGSWNKDRRFLLVKSLPSIQTTLAYTL
jgi:hypothetical protein